MRISLRTKMLLMSFIIVSISVLTSGGIMVYRIVDVFEAELGERAKAIARTVAQVPKIREYVGKPGGQEVIQPLAERTRIATNVDYIVIIDMNRIRYSHPVEGRIGREFVGGDENAALAKREYISMAQGTLGYSVRAFVPIFDDTEVTQVGVAVVGILLPTFKALIVEYQMDILLSLIWGLLIGLLGSLLLANHIKKQTFNLEPYEIAKLVEERSAVMQAMNLGIIALDEDGTITFMNRLACEFTHTNKSDKNKLHLRDVFPDSWQTIHSFIQTEDKSMINRNIVLFDKTYLLSSYHIHVKDALVGYFITMVDRTDANRLAEELTGVKTLVDSLRAQNHEYMNKLHSIAGLIQLDRTERALEIIIDETTEEEEVLQFLKDRISDYSVSGLFLGKRARARELGVSFIIDDESYLNQVMDGLNAGDVVTVLGNLVENAFESFSNDQTDKEVRVLLTGTNQHLYIKVADNGKGIPKEEQDKIFTYGYSTKEKDGRGIGLALLKEIVAGQKGVIQIHSEQNQGTEFIIDMNRGYE